MMAAAIFPAYGLARLVVGTGWALFAAAGTGLSPALAYAPILVKEPTAYPAATLALFLIARWLTRPRRRWRARARASSPACSGTRREGSARCRSSPCSRLPVLALAGGGTR